MAVFQPREILKALSTHGVRYVIIGNLAGTLHGSPLATTDVDICPASDDDNLDALAAALRSMNARIRIADSAQGLPFVCDVVFLKRMVMLNLVTDYGDLDVSFEPSGTGGYADLVVHAVDVHLRDVSTQVAALEDVIRSKAAANREKDRLALPTLRRLLEMIRGRDE